MKHENMIQFRMLQIVALCQLFAALIVSLFYKKETLWLICERGVDARDNGYWFFMYMKKHHPEINTRYIISKDSPDRKKLASYESDLIPYRSFLHYVYLWRATHLISTHLQGYFPFVGLGVWIKHIFPYYSNKIHVNIKHGIFKDHMSFQDYSNTQLDLMVAGVIPEYQYFKSAYLYPDDRVKLTGLCRYDNLNNMQVKRQILVMPTWREWIYKKDNFLQTEFAQRYIEFLNHPSLSEILKNNNLQLIFYPHHEMQRYIDEFRQQVCMSSHIQIADKFHYDVQQLLKDSMLLITDYSSVFFDFAYMCKPVIFYQFDYIQYRQEHYNEGWFDYENGLGPVPKTLDNLIQCLRHSIETGCQMEKQYTDRVESYFPYKDSNNCERVFQAIACIHK